MDWLANFINGYCYICERIGNVICDKCFNRLINTGNSSDSLYFYNEVASKILLQSKYPPYNYYLLEFLLSKSELKEGYFQDTLLCPIPLSSERMFERKFNQAELISKFISKKLQIPYANLLKRNRNSTPLFNLGRKSRELELSNIFTVRWLTRKIIDKGTPIVLIDDISTTGQTLLQAKKALNSCGYFNVKSFTIFSA